MAAFNNPVISGVLSEGSCTIRPADSFSAHVAKVQALVCGPCDCGDRYGDNGGANVTRRSRQREASNRY